MKNTAGPFFVGLFFLAAIFTAWYSAYLLSSIQKYEMMQRQLMFMTATRSAVQNLADECIRYSDTHPALNPILLKFEIKPLATNAPGASATKPSAR